MSDFFFGHGYTSTVRPIPIYSYELTFPAACFNHSIKFSINTLTFWKEMKYIGVSYLPGHKFYAISRKLVLNEKKSKRDKGAIEKTNDKKGERGYFQLNAMTNV